MSSSDCDSSESPKRKRQRYSPMYKPSKPFFHSDKRRQHRKTRLLCLFFQDARLEKIYCNRLRSESNFIIFDFGYYLTHLPNLNVHTRRHLLMTLVASKGMFYLQNCLDIFLNQRRTFPDRVCITGVPVELFSLFLPFLQDGHLLITDIEILQYTPSVLFTTDWVPPSRFLHRLRGWKE